MIMRNLQKIFEDCLAEVKALNIPVGDIFRIDWLDMNDAWGKCYSAYTDKKLKYLIVINSEFASENISIMELRTTLCHEILHTCPRCGGHGKTWVKYALMVDKAYRYNVAAFKSKYDILNHDLPNLHQMVCPNCGGKRLFKNESVWDKISNENVVYCGWCRYEMEIEF